VSTLEVDGRDLFAQLADKVARGELLITHFVANLQPMTRAEKRYAVNARAKTWSGETLDLKITAVENLGGARPPAIVTMPQQVRELIFDEEPVPIYDEDLK